MGTVGGVALGAMAAGLFDLAGVIALISLVVGAALGVVLALRSRRVAFLLGCVGLVAALLGLDPLPPGR